MAPRALHTLSTCALKRPCRRALWRGMHGWARFPLYCCFSSGSFPPIADIASTDEAGSMIIGCPSAYVVDGDTLRCGSERLRLLGIDAPEMGSCPRWRVCVSGGGEASKRSLVVAVRYGPIRYQPITRDRYGRLVAIVWAGGTNLSCWQLRQGQAAYIAKWDNGQLISRACR